MPPQIDYKKTAYILTAGEPLSFKAYPDGSLVVIAHDGKKHRFTSDQVNKVQPKPAPKRKPAPKSKPAPKVKSASKVIREQPSATTKNIESKE